MDPPELASEPPRSRIGAASNSALHLRVLGGVMLGLTPHMGSINVPSNSLLTHAEHRMFSVIRRFQK
jgi:hypothetical protein